MHECPDFLSSGRRARQRRGSRMRNRRSDKNRRGEQSKHSFHARHSTGRDLDITGKRVGSYLKQGIPQLCEASRCRPDRPVLAIRCEDAHLKITRTDEQGSHVLYQGSEDIRGRWLDFRFVTRFDSSGEGRVDGTLDGRKIVNYRGPTLFQPAHGYPRHALIYFKTGLYRDALHEPPWTMYVDEYRKDQCPESGCR